MKNLILGIICLFFIGLLGCSETPAPTQQPEDDVLIAERGEETEPHNLPVNLTVDLYLKTPKGLREWTNYICFYDPSTNNKKKIPIRFWRVTDLHYRGSAYYADQTITALLSMTTFQERDYWDKMKFENLRSNPGPALSISSLEARIWYSDHAKTKDPANPSFSLDPVFAYKTDFDIGEANSATTLGNWRGRARHIDNYINYYTNPQGKNWEIINYNITTLPLLKMVYDIGKSGTNSGPISENAKYGTIPEGQSGCDETISWYYHEIRNAYSWYNNAFLDPAGPKGMAKKFLKEGRLYAWDNNLQKFRKLKTDWTFDSVDKTYKPHSGDFFIRWKESPVGTGGEVKGQHAMMVLAYMKKPDGTKKVMVLDYWDPVRIRDSSPITAGERYCVGKMAN